MNSKRQLDYINIIFISINHLCFAYFLKHLKWNTFIFGIFFHVLYGLFGIIIGYHRFWTHGSYETNNTFLKIFMMLCGIGTCQNTIRNWCANHRMHHRFEDCNELLDPYSIKKGFMWAHILWIFHKPLTEQTNEKKKIIQEMASKEWKSSIKIINFQQKYYILLMLLMTYIIPYMITKYFTNANRNTILASIFLRVIMVWHCTFSINSFAHKFGNKLYTKYHTSCNNHLIAFFTFGEGYHNYHHTYPNDFRSSNTFMGFNIGAWLLFCLYKLKLVKNMKIPKEIRRNRKNITFDTEYKYYDE